MGKNAAINLKKKLDKKARKKKSILNLEPMSIGELLSHAQEEIDNYQYEKAQIYCQEALKRNPDHIMALETSASLCLEIGNMDGAKHCLGRAITLQPEEGYSKYLSMAQLMEGKESCQCYLKGIELIQVSINKSDSDESNNSNSMGKSKSTGEMETEEAENQTKDKSPDLIEERENNPPPGVSAPVNAPQSNLPSLKRIMSSAYCSVAELYMTDLCDEDDAENQCRNYINKAIESDCSNPEAYQNMASFLLVKEEVEQAKEYITKSVDMWLPNYRAVDKGEAAEGSFDPVEVCPVSYTTRISCAKILIEVDLCDLAIEILEGLLEEDDEVVDSWYLLGWISHLKGEDHKDSAQYYLHRAMQVHKNMPSSDIQLIGHLEELLNELGPLPEELEPTEEEIEKELDSDEEQQDMDTD